MVYPLIVILSKIIRYTVLYKSTVKTGIGHSLIKPILNKKIEFMFLWDKETAENTDIGSATNNAMFFFQKFNWLGCSTYGEFEFAITILFNIILLYVINSFIKRWGILDLRKFFFLCFCVGTLNIYTFVLSKEPIQMLYFMLPFFILKGDLPEKQKLRYCIVALIFITFISRTYFSLMLMFALGIRWFYVPVSTLLRNRFSALFVFMLVLAGISYMVFLYVCQSMRPDDFEELLRVRLRAAENTTTVIEAVIPTMDIPLFSVNYVITILRLLFPIELARFGVQYIVFILFQLMISTVAIKSLKSYTKSSATKKIATCIFWGYILCSATFEPDFGSWIRHESATIPFMLFLLDRNNNERKNYTNCL